MSWQTRQQFVRWDLAGWRSPPVLRTWSIALAAMVAGPMAQAADATLSLACKGTATIRAAPPR